MKREEEQTIENILNVIRGFTPEGIQFGVGLSLIIDLITPLDPEEREFLLKKIIDGCREVWAASDLMNAEPEGEA